MIHLHFTSETKLKQCSTELLIMRYYALVPTLVLATVTLLSSQLTFRTEENEFTILISSSSIPIDTAISHISELQSVIDRTKSTKAQKRIHKSLTKANNIKAKFNQMSGNSRHSSRSILDSLTDTSGLILGRIFGLASSKQTRQLTSAVKEIR